jgi:outer membrane protein TolC
MKGLRELKRLLILLASISFLNATGLNYLNKEHQSSIETQKKIDKLEGDSLKVDWIGPIIATFTNQKLDQNGIYTKSKYYKVSLNQPIFKSGGIYFAILYAKANREFKSLSTSIGNQSLIKNLYEIVLNLNRADLQLRQLKLKIENSNLEIEQKKQRFLSGDDDITFLNRAMLEKNSLKISLLELQSTKKKLINSYNNITDIPYKKISLPELKLITKDEYLKKSLDLKLQKASLKQQETLKNITISNYLPTLSLVGDYFYHETKEVIDREYRNFGVRVSMPLFDINRGRNIEIKRLQTLKERLALKLKQKEIVNGYKNIMLDTKALNSKLKTLKSSIKIYKSLVKSTKAQLEAGDSSKSDLQTIKNTKKTLELDYLISKIDIKLNILKLYEKMNSEI